MSLSKNKNLFLANKAQRESNYSLDIVQLRQLTQHYFKKHNIKIIVQGDTLQDQSTENKSQIDPNYELKKTIISIKQEIANIQKRLIEDELVGYLFILGGHVEAYLITKDKIIRPITWHSLRWFQAIPYENMPEIYRADWLRGQPQSTPKECGTLSLLYLKELLKDNGRQLREYSLHFACYSDMFDLCSRPSLDYFFIPSPQVLRYSQSNKFNEYVESCVLKESKEEDSNKKHETLEGLLRYSIRCAKELKDGETFKSNKELLDSLPEFRTKWIAEFKKSQEKRNMMNDITDINRYLTYRAKKMIETAERSQKPAASYCKIL